MEILRSAVQRAGGGRSSALWSAVVVGASLLLWLGPTSARAEVACPNPIPVVDENACHTGTTAWQTEEDGPDLGGYPTETSVEMGEDVTLKIAHDGPQSLSVDIDVFRMGDYGGKGGRLVDSADGVAINNDFECEPMDPTTGLVDCGNWQPTYTIPGGDLPASGIYLAKLTASNGEQRQIVFTVRDESRAPRARILFVLPIATYQAYNTFGGKSLYWGYEGGNTVSGTSRAVKVSFNRPFAQAGAAMNWFFGPDYDLVSWLERQGYDVSYTDDVAVHEHPAVLRDHDTVVVSGHSEYWSLEQFDGFLAARDAGINIASFSANTAYWKVRYEDGDRTLVCYKTVEGSGSAGSGSVSANDWGPDGIAGTADDALGLDGIAGTVDDNPQNATTTFRDDGAPPGDPSAPPGGRVGPDRPENELFGVMYVGDNDGRNFPLAVPPANAEGEFAADRVWRNTGIAENATTEIGERLVGWEWDTIPTQAQYLSRQPAGVIRLTETDVQVASDNSWLLDEGRLRATIPPPGQPGTISAVRYTAPSGAAVFAGGTIEWARGLSNEPDPRIQQATYNILSDMGDQPATPDGVELDPGGSNLSPNAGFTVSADPTKSATAVEFDGSQSTDPDGSIVDYEWDLDGDGVFETDSGSDPTVTHSFPAEGEFNVRLRVTDDGGATDLAVRTVTVIDNQAPSAAFTATPSAAIKEEPVEFDATGSGDPDGTIVDYAWDFDGDGEFETDAGAGATTEHAFATPGTYTVGLRVTDNGGKTATAAAPVQVTSGEVSEYSDAVIATPGLVHYWRMGDESGPSFADSAGSSPAGAFGSPTFGVLGGVPEDPDHAAQFDGIDDAAKAPVNLAGTHAVTVEFWMRWNSWGNDDRLAMELTPNFNELPGGFLIDPNAPQEGGKFGVGIGIGASRNNAFFDRPSAGEWHHYAFVLDTGAAAGEQITPYVDGEPVAYTKTASGGSGGNFADSDLFLMSRAAGALFGAGAIDEVAIYRRALPASAISDHYRALVVEEEWEEEGEAEEEGGPGEEGEGPPPGGEGPSYAETVRATPTLRDYWRLDEPSGPSFADSIGPSPATAIGEPQFGAAGGVPGDPDAAARFDGTEDAAAASLDLSGTTALTVEFWLKWDTWANDDRLALEFTPDFNSVPGGFLVDPNSSYGFFAASLGIGASRNVALFARPSAGQWHHYAFVLDTGAPPAEQIIPYVDGQPVAYTKAENGDGAGAFADSTLYLMSRAGSTLFGAGTLDDLAIYESALDAATVSEHRKADGAATLPLAAFQAPATAKVGEAVAFDAGGSSDPDGTIAEYEWDFDGDGEFETAGEGAPTATHTYTEAGSVAVGLRVRDDEGNAATTVRTVTVEAEAEVGEEEGEGEAPADYASTVLETPGLLSYWRLEESAGTTLADSVGTSPALSVGEPSLGLGGALAADNAVGFDGINDSAAADVDLSGTTALTIEFWLKWDSWVNNDDLALELTPNFNSYPGGLLVDPNSTYGSFAVALGIGASRNVALFARPSAGQWHHYAFVLDTGAPPAEQIIPYVDGQPVAYTKAENGDGAGAFADSTLYLMSRANVALFGAGTLDEPAIYDQALDASTIAAHFAAN